MSLNDLRIRSRILLLPLFPLLSILGVMFVAYMGLESQGRDLKAIASTAFRHSQETTRLAGLASQLHAELYRSITWYSVEVPKEAMAKALTANEKAQSTLGGHLDSMIADATWDAEDRVTLDAIKKAIEDYKSYIGSIMRMAEDDVNGATSFMWSAQDAFEKLQTQLESQVERQRNLVTARERAAEAAAMDNERLMAGIGIAALLLTILISFLVGRTISRPVAGMTVAMRKLAEGQLDVQLPPVGRGNEFAEMGAAVEVFRQNAIEVETNREREAERQREAEQHKRETMMAIAVDIEQSVRGAVNSAGSAVRGIQVVAEDLRDSAQRTNKQSFQVAVASEQTSSSVNSVAQASARLVSAIETITGKVTTSADIARRAVDQATATDGTVQNLLAASNRISDVIQLVGDIASQTNLLALNATIEAARAGDVGRGFAVVATEVKKLASETATATDEITSQVNAIREETERTVAAIAGIRTAISEVSGVLDEIRHAVADQGSATGEISANISEVAGAAQKVSSDIQEVQAIAERTGESALNMSGTAQQLNSEFDSLLSVVDSLVSRLKAA
jgi:methyl-accepting chemotaxis protein